MFTYLNYARYGIAKLAGLTRLSKTVCETRDKFLKYPQDMIDYYNSVAKIIYGSSEVTDVTTVGDKNGFRAQSTARIGEIFKGLSSYEVPVFSRRSGYTSRPILSGLNIYLNGYIEDQNRMKIETIVVDTYSGVYAITIGYIPQISFIVFVQAIKIGPSEKLYLCAEINGNRIRGVGKFSQGFIFLENATPEQLVVRVASFRNGSERMSLTRNTDTGKFLLSPEFILIAQQSGFLYYRSVCTDLDETTLSEGLIETHQRTDSSIYSDSYSAYGTGHEVFSSGHFNPSSSSHQGNIWETETRVPDCYEIAINDATAIALMYVLSEDIMAEINAA